MKQNHLNKSPQLSIVIVSWNTRNLLLNCLHSVAVACRQHASISAETIVVDNASTDGSVEATKTQFPGVRVIENDENVGFATANNQAMGECNGDYILLLNPDTIIASDALRSLVDFMNNTPDAGAAGSMLRNPNGTLQPSCYVAPTPARELWRLLYLDTIYPLAEYRMDRWRQNSERKVDIVQGASLIVRREIIEQVGTLDAEYFMYSEDFDWCHRIREAGWQIYWVPQSVVIHFGGQSTNQVATPMFLQLYQAKLRYFRKHHGRLTGLSYKVVLFIISILRLLFSPLTVLLNSRKRGQKMALAGRYGRLILALPNM